jgi:hypothetical protein
MAVLPALLAVTLPAWLTVATAGSPLVHTGATPPITVPLESVTTAASWIESPIDSAVSVDGARLIPYGAGTAECTKPPGMVTPAALV